MVGTVVIIASDDQVFMRIKCCKPRKNCIPFLEAGISSTVDAERDQTAFFEKRESPGVRAAMLLSLLVAMVWSPPGR